MNDLNRPRWKAIAIGVLAFGTTTARANPAPTCGYSAPYFANATTGDVVLYPKSTVSPLLQIILNDTGQNFGHVAVVVDSAGATLDEATWDGTPPSEGGCADPIDVNSLRNLSPGVHSTGSYGNDVTILKNDSQGYCDEAYSSYKIHSYGSYVANGNCASYVNASCGVPSVGGDGVYTGDAAYDLYVAAKSYIMSQVPWSAHIPLFGCNVSDDQLGDRGAKQILNEMFFGAADQNYNYYSNIQYPDGMFSSQWPQFVSPGPTPDGIYYAHSGTKIAGVSTSQTYSCSCPYGYAYSTTSGDCEAPTISYIIDDTSGAYNSAHPGGYISIYGTNLGSASDGVWIYTAAGCQCGVTGQITYASPTQINVYVPTDGAVFGAQQLELMIPGVAAVFTTINVMGASCSPSCSGTTCGASDGCGGTCQAGSGCTTPVTCSSGYTCADYASYGCSSNQCCSFGGWQCDASNQCLVNDGCAVGGGGGVTCSFSGATSIADGGYWSVNVSASVSNDYVYWYGTHNGVTDATNVYAGTTPYYSSPGPFYNAGDWYTRYAVIRDGSGNAVCTTNTIQVTIQ